MQSELCQVCKKASEILFCKVCKKVHHHGGVHVKGLLHRLCKSCYDLCEFKNIDEAN